MTDEPDRALVCSSLLAVPGVVGVGYGLKETAGRLTRQPAWRVYVREKRPLRQLGDAERVPAHIGGLSTDVIAHAPASPAAGTLAARPRAGAKIANSRGVPGTLGCIANSLHDRRPVLLSNWHVLFGNGAQEDATVWLVDETDGTRRFSGIGKTLYGKIGTVQLGREEYFVDCAVGSCLHPPEIPYGWRLYGAKARLPRVTGHDIAQPGYCVTKTGAATGTTTGIVVDVNYPDFVWIEGRTFSAPQQLLVKPVGGQAAFSDEGDSGAIIISAEGKVVGLLWGTNSRGEGVACPIVPVLHAMNITLDPPPRRSLLRRVRLMNKCS